MRRDVAIDEKLVRRLLCAQFPRWADLPIRRLVPGGWDNASFRLGDDMIVRLPTSADYAMQPDKEQRWLPMLARSLPLLVPEPLGRGEPADGYPYAWSILRWIEGDDAASSRIDDMRAFAEALARFLVALQSIDTAGAPVPGAHNFYRGGPLGTYDAQTRRAIAALRHVIDAGVATELWHAALATRWQRPAVWLHGDVGGGNLLVRDGRLRAVIDFGMAGVGDPACDLAIAWTMFGGESRQAFRETIGVDSATWARARGWTLWKASIVAAGLADTNEVERAQCWRTLQRVLE